MKITLLILIPLGCLLYFLYIGDTTGAVWSAAGFILGTLIYFFTTVLKWVKRPLPPRDQIEGPVTK